MTSIKAPELLLPADTLQRMHAAFDFGADAVNAGQPRYSFCARNYEFKLEQLGIGVMNSKDLRAVEYVERLAKIGLDSLTIKGRTKSHDDVAQGKPVQVWIPVEDPAEGALIAHLP